MTFAEIEQILGAALPKSAYRYRPWWANQRAGTRVHARAWECQIIGVTELA